MPGQLVPAPAGAGDGDEVASRRARRRRRGAGRRDASDLHEADDLGDPVRHRRRRGGDGEEAEAEGEVDDGGRSAHHDEAVRADHPLEVGQRHGARPVADLDEDRDRIEGLDGQGHVAHVGDAPHGGETRPPGAGHHELAVQRHRMAHHDRARTVDRFGSSIGIRRHDRCIDVLRRELHGPGVPRHWRNWLARIPPVVTSPTRCSRGGGVARWYRPPR